MAKRSFNDTFWGDEFVQGLEKDAKLLFVYLWTNKRCNSSGLYEITPKTICFETDIPATELSHLFTTLESRVKWIPHKNIVWVKNFLKHQPKSPLYLKSVATCLQEISCKGIVKEFLVYYEVQGVSIPIGNGIDTVSIPIKPVSKGNGIHTVSIPYGYLPEQDLDLEQELEQELRDKGIIKGSKGLAIRLLADDKSTSFDDYVANTLTEEFKDIDIQEELKRFKLYWSEGKRELKRPKVAFRNWLINARKFYAEDKQNGNNRANTSKNSRSQPAEYTDPKDL